MLLAVAAHGKWRSGSTLELLCTALKGVIGCRHRAAPLRCPQPCWGRGTGVFIMSVRLVFQGLRRKEIKFTPVFSCFCRWGWCQQAWREGDSPRASEGAFQWKIRWASACTHQRVRLVLLRAATVKIISTKTSIYSPSTAEQILSCCSMLQPVPRDVPVSHSWQVGPLPSCSQLMLGEGKECGKMQYRSRIWSVWVQPLMGQNLWEES